MNRPPDVWRRDTRILAEYQIENWYYASDKFDRGHLTRREGLEFGDDPQAALISASDTCHWTNCTPQHERFNQNKEIWQGIERYILESSIYNNHINAQIITGSILDGGDPEYRNFQYPLQFWKIVAALDSKGSLFATAYLAGQEEVIAQFEIEITEVPFGAYKTFQTKIAEIERLTGLTFVSGAKDQTPLRSCRPARERAGAAKASERDRNHRHATTPELLRNHPARGHPHLNGDIFKTQATAPGVIGRPAGCRRAELPPRAVPLHHPRVGGENVERDGSKITPTFSPARVLMSPSSWMTIWPAGVSTYMIVALPSAR